MEEPTTVTINSEDLILTLLQALDTKVDAIQTTLATHEERSHNQDSRISRVERAGGAITLALIVALFGVFMSGCGLFSALSQPPAAAAPSAPKVDVVARAVQSTVSLQTPTGQTFCSGVASEGMIITAEHCIGDGMSFEVVYKGQTFPGVVVSSSTKHDLAFVDAVGARLKTTVPLATKAPVLGNKVVWMGYPLGEDFIMGTGIVGNPSVVLDSRGDVDWMAVYGQFIPGNSGGPVFNSKGQLIGIVSMTMTYKFNFLPVGYAVPLHTIQAAL